MRCFDCCAKTGGEVCLAGKRARMLVCGHYGCDLQRKTAEKRAGITRAQTNGDRIRKMTDEELAKWICNISDCPYCPGKGFDCRVGEREIMTGALDWLKAPDEGGE